MVTRGGAGASRANIIMHDVMLCFSIMMVVVALFEMVALLVIAIVHAVMSACHKHKCCICRDHCVHGSHCDCIGHSSDDDHDSHCDHMSERNTYPGNAFGFVGHIV